MGEYDKIIDMETTLITLGDYRSCAKHIVAREKALNKIIGALVLGTDFGYTPVTITKCDKGTYQVKIPTSLMAAVSPYINIEGDGGENITVTVWRY